MATATKPKAAATETVDEVVPDIQDAVLEAVKPKKSKSKAKVVVEPEPPWRRMGHSFQGGIQATEALQIAGLDIELVKEPLKTGPVKFNGKTFKPIKASKSVMLVRIVGDEATEVGEVHPDYPILLNRDIAVILDPISNEWPIDTIGEPGSEASVFFALKAGQSKVATDIIDDYFLVSDFRDGHRAMKVVYAPTRQDTQSVLTTGLSQSSMKIAIPHVHSKFTDDADFYIKLMARLESARTKVRAIFQEMAKTKVDADVVERVLAAVYPEPTQPKAVAAVAGIVSGAVPEDVAELILKVQPSQEKWEYYRARAVNFRKAAQKAYEQFNEGHDKIASTAWALYSAVVEFEDNRRGAKSVDESKVFGHRARAKERAFATTMALAGLA